MAHLLLTSESWSWENLIYLADFLWTSGRRQISLGGEEPTRHPQCLDFILYLLQRGFVVTVFTTGVVSSRQLQEFKRHLLKASGERLTWVCNLRDPVLTPLAPPATKRLHRFLSVLGPWTQAGFSITQPDFSLDFLFDYQRRFGLRRYLRLGLAPPAAGSPARAFNIRRVAARLYSHRHLFAAHRVRPRLDCHFPPCACRDAELGWLYRVGGQGPGGCRPAPVITPDLRVSHCLPLAPYHSRSLFEFDSMEQVERHFARWRDELTQESAGIYQDCEACLSREDGGCGGRELCRIVGRGCEAAPLRPSEDENGISPDRLPG